VVKSRTIPIAALATSLLAGSSVGVLAQDPPVEFTAEWAFGPSIASGEVVVEDDVFR
jgi:hypothetical protein